MSNVIDLAAYRAKREQQVRTQQEAQQLKHHLPVDLTSMWGIFVTSYQLIFPFKRKDDE